MTAPTTTRPARPGGEAPQLVWARDGDPATRLNGGKPMTGKQALDHIRGWNTTQGAGLAADGKIAVRNNLTGGLSYWSSQWPELAPEDALVRDLICDLPLTAEQGGLLAAALREARIDHDRAAGDLLRQLLATTSTTPREGQ